MEYAGIFCALNTRNMHEFAVGVQTELELQVFTQVPTIWLRCLISAPDTVIRLTS
jgi:hypothetical protein